MWMILATLWSYIIQVTVKAWIEPICVLVSKLQVTDTYSPGVRFGHSFVFFFFCLMNNKRRCSLNACLAVFQKGGLLSWWPCLCTHQLVLVTFILHSSLSPALPPGTDLFFSLDNFRGFLSRETFVVFLSWKFYVVLE